MSTMEFNWYNKNVKQELGKFKSAAEKLEFIFKEKEHFRTLFRSNDADNVLGMFDDLIELIKSSEQLNNPGPGKVIGLSFTTPIIPSTLNSLPSIEKVFFIHYQCDKFEDGDNISSLCVYDNIDIKIYKNDEANAIEEYCLKVDQLLNRGLIPIHWDQNSPHFGAEHIKERYKILTGKDISLQYPGSLNLAAYLIFKYGEHYVPHRRLDNLARLNGFSGIYETENSKKTFPRDRVLLLSKIYFNELKGTLKIQPDQNSEILAVPNLTFDFSPPIIDGIPTVKQSSGNTNNNISGNITATDKLGINIDVFFERIYDYQN